MINTLLLFRFQDSEPLDLDIFLFERVMYRKDSLKYKPTPFGFVALIQTKLSVRELHKRYLRKEKKHKRALPLFILNLRSERVECEGTFFRMGDLSKTCIRRTKVQTKSGPESIPSGDDILDKISEKGMDSITDFERNMLDKWAKNLRINNNGKPSK